MRKGAYDSEVFKDARHLSEVPYLIRDGDRDEYQEMEDFIRAVAAAGLADCLTSLFYDSRACFCNIETVEGFDVDGLEGQRLIQAATEQISQFYLLDVIGSA
ncbi:TPA: hypothetical protein L4594_001143 [Pseudomonas aeruginosa]|nr:hypothetical protein [Pseudomonas aeruginosa]